MENAIPPAPQNAGKKKMGCLKMLFIAFLSVVGAFVILAICLPTSESTKKEGEAKIAEIEARKSAALLEKSKTDAGIKEVEDFAKKMAEIKVELEKVRAERDQLSKKLSNAEELKKSNQEKAVEDSTDGKSGVKNDGKYNISEEDIREAKEAQERLGIKDTEGMYDLANELKAKEEAEAKKLQAMKPMEKALYLFKEKYLVDDTGPCRFPVFEFFVKQNCNDPDSFLHDELTFKLEKGTKKDGLGRLIIQERFRAKNAFNAKVINYAIMVYDLDTGNFIDERTSIESEPVSKNMSLFEKLQEEQIKKGK